MEMARDGNLLYIRETGVNYRIAAGCKGRKVTIHEWKVLYPLGA